MSKFQSDQPQQLQQLQQQQQQQQSESQQITCEDGNNVVYTEYTDYTTGTVPMATTEQLQQQQQHQHQQQQASPSSYYIYHSPAAAVSGVATPDPYFQCVPAYMPQSYVSYEQHNQMAYLSQAQVPQQAPSCLASPQNQSGMLSALNQSSYQTPPQSTQFALATATPATTIDNSSPNQMLSAGPNAYSYLMPYPTPSYHPYGSPSASYMMYSPQSPPQVAAHQQQQAQPSLAAYQTAQTPPSGGNNHFGENRNSHRPYRYSKKRYNDRRQNNYQGETTPTKCHQNEAQKSPLSCVTNEESSGVNYQYVSSPNSAIPMTMGMYSPGPSIPNSGIYSPEPYCCSPLDSSYYQHQTPSTQVAAFSSPYVGGYSINPFYPNQTDFDMSTHGLPTPSEYADSIAAQDQDQEVGKEYDDETNGGGGEQLACYTCRGRRMCFCYFLKVRYYKFPSFLDLVDHQYKKWRSNIVKTRKAGANTANTAQ